MHASMRQVLATEGQSGEQALLSGDVGALRTATGFVYGGALSGALWGVFGVLTWYLV